MADPPEQYRFKPGNNANPGGRPKLPDDIKKARQINQIEFERIMNRYLFLPAAELAEALADPNVTVLEKMVGAILTKAVKRGDVSRAEWALNRTLGKVKERVEIDSRKLSMQLHGRIPSIEELSLDNPNLTMSQLEAFSEKIGIIQHELQERGHALPDPSVVEGEIHDDENSVPDGDE